MNDLATLCREWETAKIDESVARDRRIRIEEKIALHVGYTQGDIRLRKTAGDRVVELKTPMTYKVVTPNLAKASLDPFTFASVFRESYSVSLEGLKTLPVDQQRKAARYFVVKPGKVSVVVTEGKA